MTVHIASADIKKIIYGLLAVSLMLSLTALLFVVVNLSQAARLSETPLLQGFTYQGELFKGAEPLNATCEMAFRLYDAASAGNQVGDAITTSVSITDSLFSVHLNTGGEFGDAAFDGNRRWLAIAVQCPGDAGFTAFEERQELTPAPYASYAIRAGSVDWSGLTNVPNDLAIPSGAVQFFDLASCPPGWTELTEARGRVVVGLPSGGDLKGTIGTGLTNLENRTHTHTVNPATTGTNDAGMHNHTMSGASNTGADSGSKSVAAPGHTHSIFAAGLHSHTVDIPATTSSATSHMMPYIQLLVCKKN